MKKGVKMSNFVEQPKRTFANQVLELLEKLEHCERDDFQDYRLPKYRQKVLEAYYVNCFEKEKEFEIESILNEGIDWGNVWYDDLEYDIRDYEKESENEK